MASSVFLTLVRSSQDLPGAHLLINSIRSFGGSLSRHPIWVFTTDTQVTGGTGFEGKDVELIVLNVPDQYYYADKVWACAQAESMATGEVDSLIWIDPTCLVIKPPVMYELGSSFDAAVRPVHIQNVGLLSSDPIDGFWKGIYSVLGREDITSTVDTFVDGKRIRSYFNSHAFSVNPATGLLGAWFERLDVLVKDDKYQSAYCQDELHRIFLHQAVWSALLIDRIDPARLKILPPDYNYPYNLHKSVPEDRQAVALNDLTTVAYEARSLNPDQVQDIEIRDPLRPWLLDHVSRNIGSS